MNTINGNILLEQRLLEERLAEIGEKRFHVHADLFELPTSIKEELQHLGFENTSFMGAPSGYALQVPPIVYTIKTGNPSDFQKRWKELVEILDKPGVRGYGEGEEIVDATVFPNTKYREVKFPIKTIDTRVLHGCPHENFRQTEFHLELDADRSHPELVRNLLEAGLYGGLFREPDGSTSLTLTMQGYIKDIRPLMFKLINYLNQNGGTFNGRIIEEVAVKHKLVGISNAQLPPIAERVIYS